MAWVLKVELTCSVDRIDRTKHRHRTEAVRGSRVEKTASTWVLGVAIGNGPNHRRDKEYRSCTKLTHFE
jgi:hypothetical protein